MAMPRKLMIPHGAVFPMGAYLVGEVEPVYVFASGADKDSPRVQDKDKDTDLPLWSVQVIDNDPDARKNNKTVTVKIAAKVQPVPPKNDTDSPFTLLEFEDLTAMPYVSTTTVNGKERHSVGWAYRATGLTAPGAHVSSSAVEGED